MRSFLRLVKADVIPRADLDSLKEIANPYFESATEIGSVLWQNGLLGYVEGRGNRRFYTFGDMQEFTLPPEVTTTSCTRCWHGASGVHSMRRPVLGLLLPRVGRRRRRTRADERAFPLLSTTMTFQGRPVQPCRHGT